MSDVEGFNPLLSRRIADGLIILLLAGVAFLLGCYEMGDSDIWWHLSGGRWILSHGRVPRLDPFTFASEHRAWIDIHWGFQVLVAAVYDLGGIAALILLAAAAGSSAVLVAVTARRRDWPIAITVLCWLPALVLVSWRFDPRPEIFTLLYIACFLAVLWRADQRPRLMWILPAIQVLWVNSQGLFILGPILVGFYLLEHVGKLAVERWRGTSAEVQRAKRWWPQVAGAAVAVAIACFVSPYGFDAVRFPFQIFPKVADSSNIYKNYIDELASPGKLVEQSAGMLASNWYIWTLYFLLIALPASFLFPAIWKAWQSAPRVFDRRARNPRRVPAGLFTLVGVAALILWVTWVRHKLFFSESRVPNSSQVSGPLDAGLVIAGAIAIALALRHGASVFRLLVAGAFAYLSLQAVQNASRFALVAGVILVWNLGESARALLADSRSSARSRMAGWSLRICLATILALWIVALVTDRYHGWTGERRHFVLAEQPFEFAHDAIRFAGQPGQPDRALVYDLGQTGLFDFYNVPDHKPFMDARLEMPDQETFRTYIDVEAWLQQNDPRWETAVDRMGDPLILMTHQQNYNSEALLLTHARWRCVYFDALAAVFLPKVREEANASYPTVDFADRHFRSPRTPSVPDLPGAALREGRALSNLAVGLRRFPTATWKSRIPAVLAALDRAAVALAEDASHPAAWILLGNCYWNLIPDLSVRPPTSADEWDTATGLPLAHATYCYRRALELAPKDFTALRYLFDAYRARRMADAQYAIGQRLLATGRAPMEQMAEMEALRRRLAVTPRRQSQSDLPTAVRDLLHNNRPEAAVAVVEDAESRGAITWSWPLRDRVAATYLRLGRPADARRLWERATGAPSEAERLCRLAATFWVERDFDRTAQLYEQALMADGNCTEAWWGLAVLNAQLGQPAPALRACKQGLGFTMSQRQRTELEGLQQILETLATPTTNQ
jgi:tetratricopeptide (TPR) repeat protein